MTEEQSKELLSKTLLEAMSNKKMNNAQLGELIGADKSTVGRWINKEALLKVNFIPDICRILEISPNILFNYVDKNSLTPKQLKLINAYESKPEIQQAIDKLLDI